MMDQTDRSIALVLWTDTSSPPPVPSSSLHSVDHRHSTHRRHHRRCRRCRRCRSEHCLKKSSLPQAPLHHLHPNQPKPRARCPSPPSSAIAWCCLQPPVVALPWPTTGTPLITLSIAQSHRCCHPEKPSPLPPFFLTARCQTSLLLANMSPKPPPPQGTDQVTVAPPGYCRPCHRSSCSPPSFSPSPSCCPSTSITAADHAAQLRQPALPLSQAGKPTISSPSCRPHPPWVPPPSYPHLLHYPCSLSPTVETSQAAEPMPTFAPSFPLYHTQLRNNHHRPLSHRPPPKSPSPSSQARCCCHPFSASSPMPTPELRSTVGSSLSPPSAHLPPNAAATSLPSPSTSLSLQLPSSSMPSHIHPLLLYRMPTTTTADLPPYRDPTVGHLLPNLHGHHSRATVSPPSSPATVLPLHGLIPMLKTTFILYCPSTVALHAHRAVSASFHHHR